nr:MAG TPA: hypothetical protein [Caudoviricetes sp.]
MYAPIQKVEGGLYGWIIGALSPPTRPGLAVNIEKPLRGRHVGRVEASVLRGGGPAVARSGWRGTLPRVLRGAVLPIGGSESAAPQPHHLCL